MQLTLNCIYRNIWKANFANPCRGRLRRRQVECGKRRRIVFLRLRQPKRPALLLHSFLLKLQARMAANTAWMHDGFGV